MGHTIYRIGCAAATFSPLPLSPHRDQPFSFPQNIIQVNSSFKMPYKLEYFDGRGRAELIRLLFAEAGVEFEDSRIAFDQWAAIKGDKERFPLGFMPVLEQDGRRLCQTMVIARHLAREFDMAGKDEKERTVIDLIAETAIDLQSKVFDIMFAKEEAVKAEKVQKFTEEQAPKVLDYFTTWLKKNDGGNGFMVGSKMTLADVTFYAVFEKVEAVTPGVLAKYPEAKALYDRVAAAPKIAAWLKKRPVTSM